MTSFIESAAIDIGDGDKFAYISRIIPDLTFSGSTANVEGEQATFTVKARNFPGAAFDNTDDGTSAPHISGGIVYGINYMCGQEVDLLR